MSRRRASKVGLTRREFMQGAAAVAAGAPLALHARERDDDDDDDPYRGRAACGGHA
jgi:hypothetical protein